MHTRALSVTKELPPRSDSLALPSLTELLDNVNLLHTCLRGPLLCLASVAHLNRESISFSNLHGQDLENVDTSTSAGEVNGAATARDVFLDHARLLGATSLQATLIKPIRIVLACLNAGICLVCIAPG